MVLKKVEIMVLSKYLSSLWRTPEMPLMNYEINYDLNWSEKWVTVAPDVVDQGATSLITDRKLCVPVVTLSTQDNTKLPLYKKWSFLHTVSCGFGYI